MKTLFSYLVVLLMSFQANAQKNTDFVTLLLNQINEPMENEANENFSCVTVSPVMMEKMLEMTQTDNSQNNEQIQCALQHVKSMRIFSATKNMESYQNKTEQLLHKHSKRYKPLQADANNTRKPCVWVRKSGKKVIEMVVINIKEKEAFNVINITGNMDKTFVNELLKM